MLPLVIGIRGLVDVQHIYAAFAFLKIPKKEWRHGLECFTLASVRAFSFQHRIRYAAHPGGTTDAIRCSEPISDHEYGSDKLAASDSDDSDGEQYAEPGPATRNSKKRKYAGSSVPKESTRTCVSSPSSALTMIPAKRNRCSRARQCTRMRSHVGTAIRGQQHCHKQVAVTAKVSRRLRLRPYKVDELQFKAYDTNDPNHPIDTIQQYPPGYGSTKWTQWKTLERNGRGRT